jgi:hypothetical protein
MLFEVIVRGIIAEQTSAESSRSLTILEIIFLTPPFIFGENEGIGSAKIKKV